jgi:tetraacyldisaccharide 4'-kinase
VIQSIASVIYGAIVARRRRWYDSHPSRQERLSRPVVSIGNLRAGGSGKTPAVGYIARLLLAHGHRPAILTRGYARRVHTPGVTIVSDGTNVLETIDTAGDEPLMLARALTGVPVLVNADRYAAGQVAESRFQTTVHLLDDGFQHLKLARDVDLLMASEEDLSDRVLPAGHLREGLQSAVDADCLIVPAQSDEDVERVRRVLGVKTAFRMVRSLGQATSADRVFAVAGIARPERFFGDLRSAGWAIAGTMAFADHHDFGRTDLERIVASARAAGASTIVTTEKDGVRLEGHSLGGLTLVCVPLTVAIEPAGAFTRWLLDAVGSSPHGRARSQA